MTLLFALLMLANPGQNLEGSWKLNVEETGMAQRIKGENLYFYPGNKIILRSGINYRGTYEIKEDKIIMKVMMGGKESLIERTFKLEDDKLSLTQEVTYDHDDHSGHEHKDESITISYARESAKPPVYDGITTQILDEGYFTLSLTDKWIINRDPVNSIGGQRVTFQDTEGTIVSVMHIPGREGHTAVLSGALRGMMMPLLHSFKLRPTDITEKEGTFYNREGTRLEAQGEIDGKKMNIHTFGHKLPGNHYLVMVATFEEGHAQEIEKILKSLKVRAFDEVERPKEDPKPKAKPRPRSHHGHSHGHRH